MAYLGPPHAKRIIIKQFTIPAVKTLRCDVARTGVEGTNAQGRMLDFHALRTTFASLKTNRPNDVLAQNRGAVKSAVRKGPQGAPSRAKVRKDQIVTDPIVLLDWMKQHDYNVPLDSYLPLNAPKCAADNGPVAKLAKHRAISSVG